MVMIMAKYGYPLNVRAEYKAFLELFVEKIVICYFLYHFERAELLL